MTTPDSAVVNTNDGASTTAPGDALRISDDEYRTTYDHSFKQWSLLHSSVIKSSGFPFVDLRGAFRDVPRFPRQFALKRVAVGKQSRVYANGFSAWGTSALRCLHPPRPFELPVEIEVASTHVNTLVTETPPDGLYTPWFGGRPNYVAVLALAWSYILSARWAEIMPAPCTITYTSTDTASDSSSEQKKDSEDVVIDIGDASKDEVQWWSAILQQGRSWKASMDLDAETFRSPWSVHRQGSDQFILTSRSLAPTTSTLAASFSDARHFLDKFIARHDIADQSQAALAAILLFPVFGRSAPLSLPVSLTEAMLLGKSEYIARPASPTSTTSLPGSPDSLGSPSSPESSRSSNFACSLGSSSHPDTSFSSGHGWEIQDEYLDKLIVLSCYSRGIRPMLMSVFYDPRVACNASSASLQGQLHAINMYSRDGPIVLGQILMDRSPQVAFLWLGATMLGKQERLIKELGWTMLPIDLTSAAWSGTVQSFMQMPTLPTLPTDTDTSFSRADECKLLYLCQEEGYTDLPTAQWRPFGVTPADDVDLEVRKHIKCNGHQLRYQGFRWAGCQETRQQLPLQKLARLLVWIWPLVRRRVMFLLAEWTRRDHSQHTLNTHTHSVPNDICHESMRLDNQSTSENSTRMILCWLRVDGWARHEREIWSHEWFSVLESDDEDDEEEEEETSSCPGAAEKSSAVEHWISCIP